MYISRPSFTGHVRVPYLNYQQHQAYMRAWLIDIYRAGDSLVAWLKDPDDIRLKLKHTCEIYVDDSTVLDKLNLRYRPCIRKTYHGKRKVYAVEINRLSNFELIVSMIEKKSRHRACIYNADVKPEQDYLYRNNLSVLSQVEVRGQNIISVDDDAPSLSKADISIDPLKINGKACTLKSFAREFRRIDPDVIFMQRAFHSLPLLDEILRKHGIACPFHRWDDTPIRYRGGRTFFSYGRTAFRDYSIHLKGRFLIDSAGHIGSECDLDGIVELAKLSGSFFQQAASRSFGSVFQQALVREMFKDRMLIPYKEKPIENALSMYDLVKSDRVGHTFDPKPGLYTDVAEIDFSSMYPWVMYNHNISAETISSEVPPFENVPQTPFRISLAKKGLVPRAIKRILDRRMHYKRNPSRVNNAKAAGLKWVLVSSYGYCRFREFKLGIASTHMAIGAFAREIIISAAELAEELGFEVIHGIIDSLYIHKENLREEDVEAFCKEVEYATGIPISNEGIFRWVMYLPSINDKERPMPSRYFGVYRDGRIKARGIEVREKSCPYVVRNFQKRAIEILAQCSSREDMLGRISDIRRLFRQEIEKLPDMEADWLAEKVTVSKTDYKHNIPQKIAVEKMKEKGIEIKAGQKVAYVFSRKGIELIDDYSGMPDMKYYRDRFLRALFVIYQALGIERDEFEDMIEGERQMKLLDYKPNVKQVYVHIHRLPKDRKGYSEKAIRRRMEKSGWIVWRGGFLHATRKDELYPNVRKKYELLEQLMDEHKPGMLEELQYMCKVHHGMPDFFAFKNGRFKFVECKLIYEQLSPAQKTCIKELLKKGYNVEMHRIVDHRTKAREAIVNVRTGEKKVLEEQLRLTKKLAATNPIA